MFLSLPSSVLSFLSSLIFPFFFSPVKSHFQVDSYADIQYRKERKMELILLECGWGPRNLPSTAPLQTYLAPQSRDDRSLDGSSLPAKLYLHPCPSIGQLTGVPKNVLHGHASLSCFKLFLFLECSCLVCLANSNSSFEACLKGSLSQEATPTPDPMQSDLSPV